MVPVMGASAAAGSMQPLVSTAHEVAAGVVVSAGAVVSAALELAVTPHVGVRCGNDEALAALALWQQWHHDTETCLRAASHGQRLIGIGNHDADFACCASVDNLTIVPTQTSPGVLQAA